MEVSGARLYRVSLTTIPLEYCTYQQPTASNHPTTLYFYLLIFPLLEVLQPDYLALFLYTIYLPFSVSKPRSPYMSIFILLDISALTTVIHEPTY